MAVQRAIRLQTDGGTPASYSGSIFNGRSECCRSIRSDRLGIHRFLAGEQFEEHTPKA